MFEIKRRTKLNYSFAMMLIVLATVFCNGATVAQSENKQIAPIANSSLVSDAGDEFEPTKVLAIVGGEPIFVGDILFEVNQLIARFMPNAPANLVKRERRALVRKCFRSLSNRNCF